MGNDFFSPLKETRNNRGQRSREGAPVAAMLMGAVRRAMHWFGRAVAADELSAPAPAPAPVAAPYAFDKSGWLVRVRRAGCEYDGLIDGIGSDVAARWLLHGAPAGFGDVRRQLTVVDPAVRRGRDISADRGEFEVGDAVLRRAEEMWASSLQPRAVRARAYKINVYGPHDGFAFHRDTPERGMVGTLLVMLYSTLYDDYLVLAPPFPLHGGRELRWQAWGNGSWCAFFP